MTRSEFIRKYRGRFLLFVTEAWAARRESPQDLGLLVDGHMGSLKNLLAEIYDDLVPKDPPPPPNGQAAQPQRKVNP